MQVTCHFVFSEVCPPAENFRNVFEVCGAVAAEVLFTLNRNFKNIPCSIDNTSNSILPEACNLSCSTLKSLFDCLVTQPRVFSRRVSTVMNSRESLN